jgi:hypothetical protein
MTNVVGVQSCPASPSPQQGRIEPSQPKAHASGDFRHQRGVRDRISTAETVPRTQKARFVVLGTRMQISGVPREQKRGVHAQ